MKITVERNAQIVISLMKAYGVRKIIASPGTTNVCFIRSVQQDPYFEVYSAADERSAAYIACGLAEESGEPVALNCTGATASRNYMSGLTEAFYSKLPILAITSSKSNYLIGHNCEQMTDRTALPNDIAVLSVQLPFVVTGGDEWACMINANKAFLALRHNGGGPVHINLESKFSPDYVDAESISPVRVIRRVTDTAIAPKIAEGKIAIMVGSRVRWTEELTAAVDVFCRKYNAVVLCDATSNYKGGYRLLAGLATRQDHYVSLVRNLDLLIDIGEVSSAKFNLNAKQVWRISRDGELRDTFRTLSYVFQMSELDFFCYYGGLERSSEATDFYEACIKEQSEIMGNVPDLPFSNFWMAQQSSTKLPENSVLHLGIRNSLRAWSFFELPKSVLSYSNTGGFGIDGCTSAAIGASLADKNKLVFLVVGDLAFFYDLNALGNRHIGSNVRILLVNNGLGAEFKFRKSPCSVFGEETNPYLAAEGHYGAKSPELIKCYAENLGFRYISASTKEEYLTLAPDFFSPDTQDRPVVFETFVLPENEVQALESLETIVASASTAEENRLKRMAKKVMGEKGVQLIRQLRKE